ncbi:reverse transcriptase domain-containing protein, partial [Tanacetum coccineum]
MFCLCSTSSTLTHRGALRAQKSDKGKGKKVVGPFVNMTKEGGKNKNNKQNKGKKCGFKDNNDGSSSNKKPKLECWKCGKTGHFKRDCRIGNKKNNLLCAVDAIACGLNFGATHQEMLRNCHGHNLSKGNIIKIFYHGLNEITQEVLNAAAGGIFLYKTLNMAYQLLKEKVLLKFDWAKNQKAKSSLKKTVAFATEGSSNSNTDKIMARMDAMIMKIDAQYKDFQSRLKQSNLDDDDIPMSRDEEAKFMQNFRRTRFYNDYRNRDSNRYNWHSSGRNYYNQDDYQSYF